jgi:hypothetical protein
VRVLDGNIIRLKEEVASGELLSPIFDMIRGLNARAMCLHQQEADYLLRHWIKGLTLFEIIRVADQ